MFGFDEKERQKEGKGSPKNPDKVNTKLTFDVGVTVLSVSYEYKVNVTALRIKNISSYSFTINSKPVTEIIMLNPGDVLKVTVVKDDSSGVAVLTLQEKLIY